VFVVRSGPSLERMKMVAAVAGAENGENNFWWGISASWGSKRAIPYLIEAARYITHDLKAHRCAFLQLVGSGPSLEAMKQLANDEGVAHVITFTGRVSDKQLLEVLNTADCLPSIRMKVNPMNDKSTMNKIMEYMALGKPIVQFDVYRRSVFCRKMLRFMPKQMMHRIFAAKILWLLDNPAAREEKWANWGVRASKMNWAWPHEAPKLLDAYEAVFAKKSWRGKNWRGIAIVLAAMSSRGNTLPGSGRR